MKHNKGSDSISSIDVGEFMLKNRLIMASTYLGYAGQGGTVSRMILDYMVTMMKK